MTYLGNAPRGTLALLTGRLRNSAVGARWVPSSVLHPRAAFPDQRHSEGRRSTVNIDTERAASPGQRGTPLGSVRSISYLGIEAPSELDTAALVRDRRICRGSGGPCSILMAVLIAGDGARGKHSSLALVQCDVIR